MISWMNWRPNRILLWSIEITMFHYREMEVTTTLTTLTTGNCNNTWNSKNSSSRISSMILKSSYSLSWQNLAFQLTRGWVALSPLVHRPFVRPASVTSPLYDVWDHTNHIILVRIWSWQSSVHHQCIISASKVHHQCITRASSVHQGI